MFEIILHEWGLDPIHIAENWTEEMLILMVSKMSERMQNFGRNQSEGKGAQQQGHTNVPEQELFQMAGINYVGGGVKHGD